MKLLPIRFVLAMGPWRLIEATLLDREDEQPELVDNDTLFGFQIASDEAVDEVELNLAKEEGKHATPSPQ